MLRCKYQPYKPVTYLSGNVSPFLLCNRIHQRYWGCVDEIALALRHPQMDSTVRPGLHVKIPIPRFDIGMILESPGVSWVAGLHSLGQARPLYPLKIFKLVMDLCTISTVVSSKPLPCAKDNPRRAFASLTHPRPTDIGKGEHPRCFPLPTLNSSAHR